jgi:ketosteroid isomerase-like protein
MRILWIAAVLLAFFLGIAVEKAFLKRSPSPASSLDQNAALAGIEKLHQLDQRVTLLNDPKALQELWTNDAVRLAPDSPVDIGKPAIYATDTRTWANAPGFSIVSYKPDLQDVRVVNDWAFEWGLFDAGYRLSADKPVFPLRGKLLRIIHRESNGDWKFARVMVVLDTSQSLDASRQK